MVKTAVFLITFSSLCICQFKTVHSATLSCTLDSVVEVTINKTDNKVSCTGVGGSSQTVIWTSKLQADRDYTVGTCNATAGDNCEGWPGLGFTPRRPTGDISTMTINASALYQGFLGFPLTCRGNTTDACKLIDLIYPAEALCSHVISTTNWTINSTCNISKVYSHANRYYCQFFREMSANSQGIEVQQKKRYNTSVHADLTYRTGTCDFNNDGIPPDNGDYHYRALILPGYVSVDIGFLVVAAPSVATISCATQSAYVAENEELRCTCNSPNIGLPGGRLMCIRIYGNDKTVTLGNYNETSLPLTLMVNRTHNGQRLHCDVDWVKRVNGTTFYTIAVAYGPDSVNIIGNRTFYTDSQGTKYLTLRCQPVNSNPSSNLTYSWSDPCVVVKNDTCTFRPRPPGSAGGSDVNAKVTCSASNSFNRNKMTNASVVLDLKYAPREAPTMSGYSENEALFQGDPLTLSCAIPGGDPPVTSVSVTCGTSYSNKTSGQSSLLKIDSLNGSDHGLQCTCHGQWIIPEYYTLAAKTNLTVYSPPSYPSITAQGGTSLPYMEYDKVTLTCSITRSGHPNARLSWSSPFGGKVNYSSDVTSYLYFDSIRKDLDGVNVTCHATNDFTQHKQVDINSSVQLKVYYRPRLRLLSEGETSCTTHPDICLVSEGHTVIIRCVAESNPSPQNYRWTMSNGQQLSINPELTIPAASRNHSGVYSVVVVTAKPDSSDPRLPLSASSNLTILVKYGASNTILRLNKNASSVVTVRENDTVTINCTSYGRPTPSLQLFQDGRSVLNATGNILALTEEENSLRHTVASAQCNDTGTYSCSADNQVGKDVGQEVTLRVNCRPRKTQQKDDVPLVTFTGHPVTLTFSLEAVPVPDQYAFYHYSAQANSSSLVGHDISVRAFCFRTFGDQHEYAVTCNVTVSDVTDSSADGVYGFRAGNDYGFEEFPFEVKYTHAGSASQSQEELNVGGIAGGLMAGLLVIVAVAAAVFIMRKRIKRKDGLDECSSRKSLAHLSELEEPRPASTRSEHPYDNDSKTENSTSHVSSVPSSSTGTLGHDVYAVVQKQTTGRQEKSTEAQPEVSVVRIVKKAVKAKADSSVSQNPKKLQQQKKVAKLKDSRQKDPISTPLSMKPIRSSSDNVYENHAFQDDEPKPKRPSKVQQPVSVQDGHTVRVDDLVYTTIAFTQDQNKKSMDPSPQRDVVEYASLDFTITKKNSEESLP